jgi:hypothetical protein
MRDRVRLLHAACIWQASLAHVRIVDIVLRAIRCAVRVLGPGIRCRRVREVIINCARERVLSANHVRAYTRRRTEFDQLVLEPLNYFLQNPVCVL